MRQPSVPGQQELSEYCMEMPILWRTIWATDGSGASAGNQKEAARALPDAGALPFVRGAYSDDLVRRVIERVTVLSREEIVIRFVGGDGGETEGWKKYEDVEKSETQPDDVGAGQGNI